MIAEYVLHYFLFFSSSNLRVRSSKSTSSPPAEVPPAGGTGKLLPGTWGRSGIDGRSGISFFDGS